MRSRMLLVQCIESNKLYYCREQCKQEARNKPKMEHLGDLTIHHSIYLESRDTVVLDRFEIPEALDSLAIALHTLV